MTRKLIALLVCLSSAQLASGAVRVLKLSDGEPFVMGKVDSRRLIRPDMGARKLTLNYSVFQPGFEFPQHVHPRSDDIFLVFQGQADVRQGESRKGLKAGQAVFVPAGQIHGGISTGKGTSILISFQCPPDEALYTGKRDSSKAGAAKPVGVITPGAVKFVDFAARNGVFLGPKQGSTKVTAAHWKLRRGEKLTIANRADGEQFLFVWQGRLTLRTTEGALEVGERETAFISGSEALEAVNPAPGDAIVIQVRTVSTADAFSAEKLNVLLVAVDDLRPNLGCYGEPGLQTPNMDRLAARGMLFRRAYCQIASCGPSRASLLTGRRPDTTTVFDNRRRFRTALPDVVTLPQHFKNHGYHTRSFGKVFHGIFSSEINDDPPSWSVPAWRPKAVQYRTEEGIRILRQRYPRHFHDPSQSVEDIQAERRFKGLAVEAPDVDDNDLIDGRTADKAIEVMRRIKDKPFFLAVGFVKPHAPYVAPKKYFDLYNADDFTFPAVDELPQGAPPQAHNNDSRELRGYAGIASSGPIPMNQAQWVTHGYNACVSYVDTQIGRLINELERLGLGDKTMIVLWGDHGYHLGHNGLWCKNTNFEAAARVPLIVSAPGAKAKGQSTDALVELVDLYPTLAELCSLPVARGLHGTSFTPLLDRPKLTWEKAAFTQTPRPYTRPAEAMGRSIRTDRYRLVEWTGTKLSKPLHELYDYTGSAPEKINLAGRPGYQPVVKELTELLHAGWKACLPPQEGERK